VLSYSAARLSMAASAVHPALTYGPSVNLYIPSTSAALSEYTRGYSQVLERNYVLIGARLSTLSRAIGARAAYGIYNNPGPFVKVCVMARHYPCPHVPVRPQDLRIADKPAVIAAIARRSLSIAVAFRRC
jgi:hypothetical protein